MIQNEPSTKTTTTQEPFTTINESEHDIMFEKYDDVPIDDVDVEKGTTLKTHDQCRHGLIYKSHKSQNAAFSAFACNAVCCVLVLNGILSIGSVNGIGSILSINSMLSIASANSFMAIGCHGGFMKICL